MEEKTDMFLRMVEKYAALMTIVEAVSLPPSAVPRAFGSVQDLRKVDFWFESPARQKWI